MVIDRCAADSYRMPYKGSRMIGSIQSGRRAWSVTDGAGKFWVCLDGKKIGEEPNEEMAESHESALLDWIASE